VLAEELVAQGERITREDEGALWPPEAIVLDGPLTDALRARMAAGELVAQSRGSQAVVAVLDPQPEERLLDLCAAPGMKTTGIAARMRNRGEVLAVDRDPGRARQMEALCERLGATCVRVTVGDAERIDLGDGYDRVLVDPPCSDLGTLASRPDARWRKSPELIERVAEVQAKILTRARDALRSGGTLVYSVCTISRREGPDQVADASRSLQIRPDRDGTDGFFIARLEQT
jgi:16S rRNA (cytosine967-C5)-methyltransferase